MDQSLIDEVLSARAATLDRARPEAVAKVRARGHLTARERIAAVLDAGSFVEYGVLADSDGAGAADGLVNGFGQLDGKPIAVASYDYSVFGGSQSFVNHNKLERIINVAYDQRLPFLCFSDGGGLRTHALTGTATRGGQRGQFHWIQGLAMMSGWAPTVAVVSGRAFAGNATIAGHSDLVIATRGSAVGMGGPPLVEEALGIKVTPEELGAVEMHEKSGGIDLLVADEPAAIAAAKQYLRFFLHEENSVEPPPTAGSIASIVPENRRRAYDMRKVVHALVDAESLFELRPNWAKTVITALARMGGKTVGLLANQPMSNRVGAIDADACDKITRFVQLCDAFDFPLVSLIDNPGFMIGPDAERAGIARRHARTIMAHVHRTVPLYCVQIRKGYGLGPAAMGGMYGRCDLSLAWPTCETGGMGLEGAASLAQRDQIAAAGDDQAAIRAIREEYAAEARRGKSGLSAGRNNSFDDIVDPAETRDRIIAILRFNQRAVRTQKKHYIDTW